MVYGWQKKMSSVFYHLVIGTVLKLVILLVVLTTLGDINMGHREYILEMRMLTIREGAQEELRSLGKILF